MSTVRSSTERTRAPRPQRRGAGEWLRAGAGETARALSDVRALMRFRAAGLRDRSRTRARVGIGVMVGLTIASAVVPAHLSGTFASLPPSEVLLLLPTAYLGVLGISTVSAAASGGGRELLPRDQGLAYPVSPTTDHLGALLLAPLNIAWLLQTWTVLAMTAYALGPHLLLFSLLPVLVWVLLATAIAQAVAWTAEWVRRGRRGPVVMRSVLGTLTVVLVGLALQGTISDLLDRAPLLRVVIAAADGSAGVWGSWAAATGTLVLLLVGVVALGALPAHLAAGRAPRDELRLESGRYRPRPDVGSDLAALVRVDRSGVWRSVPLRRGLLVLALLPGLVAFAGRLEWDMLAVLPGLVASGGALLFGVNAWCLDGRGALWRDSLPATAQTAFWARALVLTEVLLAATAVGLAISMLRSGMPTTSQLVAVLCAGLVVTVQVVAASLRWSVRRPFAVDLRSARATPAPPLVMVGYSSRLAVSTTLTGLVFAFLSYLSSPVPALLVALAMGLFSGRRLVRTSREWAVPQTRSLVVATVVG